MDAPDSPRLHPLHNVVVLDNLFSMFPKESLSTFRLVCKQWYNHTLDKWRSTLPLVFSKSGHASEDPIGAEENSDMQARVQNFLVFVDNPINEYHEKPHRQLKLKGWEFQLEANGKFHDILTERFCWGVVGCHITKLTLSQCKFKGVEEFRQIIYKFCPNLQNLILISNESLAIEAPTISEYVEPFHGEQANLKSLSLRDNGEIPVSWLELLSHFPSLESFELSLFYGSDHATMIEILQAVKTIRTHDGTKLPITSFESDPYVKVSNVTSGFTMFGLFRELNIPVKRLHFNVGRDLGRELLRTILEGHATSLTSLDIVDSWRRSLGFPFGVNLEKLESLSISEEFCNNMEFIRYTQNLIKLQILDTRPWMPPHDQNPPTLMISNVVERPRDNLTLVKLKEFTIEYSMSAEDLGKLVRWFPNLESLKMPLNDEQFRIVCDSLGGNLKSLIVRGRNLTDMGLVGIPNDNQPNITSAQSTPKQNLATFEAHSDRLTDASVFRGFLLLPKLRNLKLHSLSRRARLAVERADVSLSLGGPVWG